MTESQQTLIPFIRFFMSRIDSFPASTTTANLWGLDSFDQHICDCLDELRHVIVLYNEYVKLKASIPKLNEIELKLKELIPGLINN